MTQINKQECVWNGKNVSSLFHSCQFRFHINEKSKFLACRNKHKSNYTANTHRDNKRNASKTMGDKKRERERIGEREIYKERKLETNKNSEKESERDYVQSKKKSK